MQPNTKLQIYLKLLFVAHQFSLALVYLMCGPEMPKVWAPLPESCKSQTSFLTYYNFLVPTPFCLESSFILYSSFSGLLALCYIGYCPIWINSCSNKLLRFLLCLSLSFISSRVRRGNWRRLQMALGKRASWQRYLVRPLSSLLSLCLWKRWGSPSGILAPPLHVMSIQTSSIYFSGPGPDQGQAQPNLSWIHSIVLF